MGRVLADLGRVHTGELGEALGYRGRLLVGEARAALEVDRQPGHGGFGDVPVPSSPGEPPTLHAPGTPCPGSQSPRGPSDP